MIVTLLAGGVGGAKFALGLRAELQTSHPGSQLNIITNIGDDMWLSGLKICPDLDSLMYALAGVNDTEQGWGRQGESERVNGELAAYGVGWPWFTLGDLDLGTHIARTGMLREGFTLTEVTQQLSARWDLGARLLPASDVDAETWVELDPSALTLTTRSGLCAQSETVHFEEWWVRFRALVPARRFLRRGPDPAVASSAVLEAISCADTVIMAPSNPVVSIGTISGFPGANGREGVAGISGIAQALGDTHAPVVGVSPIIEGAPLRGMAAQCLETVGHPCTAEAVGLAYGARSRGGLIDGWLVDTQDSDAVPALEEAGLKSVAVPLWMRDDCTSRALAAETLALAERLIDDGQALH